VLPAWPCRAGAHIGMSQVQLAYTVAASPGHDLEGHYENPRRIPAILDALKARQMTADAQPQKVRAAINHDPLPAAHAVQGICS
jgi:hypothetical protein